MSPCTAGTTATTLAWSSACGGALLAVRLVSFLQSIVCFTYRVPFRLPVAHSHTTKFLLVVDAARYAAPSVPPKPDGDSCSAHTALSSGDSRSTRSPVLTKQTFQCFVVSVHAPYTLQLLVMQHYLPAVDEHDFWACSCSDVAW